MKLSELIPDPKNARKHTPRNVSTIVDSLNEVGAGRSIVIDENNVILAGNATIEAAGKAGIQKLKVVDVDGQTIVAVRRSGLTKKQKTRLALFDNRAAELAEWDEDVLAELNKDDALADLFSDKELAEILSQTGGEPKDAEPQIDKAEELRQKWGTETGQLWIIGNHRLLVGDATNKADVGRLCGNVAVSAVITDPPYGMNLDTDWSDAIGSLKSIGHKHQTRGKKYERVIGDDAPFDPSHILEFARNIKEVFLFGADYYAERIEGRDAGSWLVWDKRKPSQSEAIGSEFELIWSKAKHKRRILRHDWFGFLSSENTADARNRMHPTQKPTSLITEIISLWNLASPITDLYAGSGTTLIAVENSGQSCYAMEVDAGYVAVCLERMTTAFPHLKIEKTDKAAAA